MAEATVIAAIAVASESAASAEHPYVSRIEITNFRNFHEFAVNLAPTTVIVGENKVGKSNLLEALRLVLDPSIPDSERKLRAEDFWDGLEKPFAGHQIIIRVFIRNFESNLGAEAILSDCIVQEKPLTALLTYNFRPRTRLDKLPEEKREEALSALDEDDYDYIVFGGNNENNRVGSDVRKWLTLILLPALRDAESNIQSWKRSPLRPLLERVKKGIPAKHFLAVRENLDGAKSTLLKAKPVGDLITAINERVRGLAGPVHAVETDLDFASSEPEQLVKSLRIFLKEKTSKPLSDASLGTANILFLALLLQDLEMKQAAKEIVSTILAIEEPEAHLHPQLQRLLFRYFLGRKHPILLTTHSPHIASVSPVESIVLLRNQEGETHGFTSAALEFTQEEADDLQRYLDVTRAEVLFARGVIFVEGVAEQFLIPAFAAAHMKTQGIGHSLDDLGISVCSVNGTDFYPYRRLLSNDGLSIPSVVITDGDPTENKTKDRMERVGLKRGCRLMYDEIARKKALEILEEGSESDVQSSLAAGGIFVGRNTLEIDLLEVFSTEMKSVYAELRNSEKAVAKFNAAVEGATQDPVMAAKMLNRIEAIGKGRFAQRLAGKLGGKKPPEYILHAIQLILTIVQPADA
jgi:putative ATP-dependent endonuclease of OLD family